MVLDTVYLCLCQNGGEAPDGIQLQTLRAAVTNGTPATPRSAELEPIK